MKMSPSNKNGLSRCQIGEIEKMFGRGLRASTVFKNIPTAEINRFIKEAGPGLRDDLVKQTEEKLRHFRGIFRIAVDYREHHAIPKAILAAGLHPKRIEVPIEHIPLVGSGEIEHEVHEVPFGRAMAHRDLPKAVDDLAQTLGQGESRFELIDPLTALRFAYLHPDRQRKYRLALIFISDSGLDCSLILGSTKSGIPTLHIRPIDGESCFTENVRFLARRVPLNPAAP